MGLIKNAIDSVKGTLKDQYQTAINCDNMGNELLLAKKTKPNGIIRNGSIIIVNPGQMAVLIDNGRVVDAAAEPGAYEWQSDASPGFFSGDFGGMFKEMWRRFAFGGATYQDQAVYYINATEIMDNGFGTPVAVPCESWAHANFNPRTGRYLPMSIELKASGNYTFRITRPDVFLSKVGGTANMYFKNELTDQMRTEVSEKFEMMLNILCGEEHQIAPTNLRSKTDIIKEEMAKNKYDMYIEDRGIKIEALVIESVTIEKESKERMDRYEDTLDAGITQDKQHERQEITKAIVGSNEAGAGVGFLGVGMMNQMMGPGNAMQPPPPPPQQPFPQQPMERPPFPQTLAQQQQVPQQPMAQQPMSAVGVAPPPTAAGGLTCIPCGQPVAGKFCANCGAAAPVPAAPVSRFCTECGAKASGGKFCAECGTPFV